MRALTAERAMRGVRVAHDTVWRFVRQAGPTVKKTLIASKQFRPKVARFRARWKTHQHRLVNRPGLTGGQNARKIAHYGTDINEEGREAVITRCLSVH